MAQGLTHTHTHTHAHVHVHTHTDTHDKSSREGRQMRRGKAAYISKTSICRTQNALYGKTAAMDSSSSSNNKQGPSGSVEGSHSRTSPQDVSQFFTQQGVEVQRKAVLPQTLSLPRTVGKNCSIVNRLPMTARVTHTDTQKHTPRQWAYVCT